MYSYNILLFVLIVFAECNGKSITTINAADTNITNTTSSIIKRNSKEITELIRVPLEKPKMVITFFSSEVQEDNSFHRNRPRQSNLFSEIFMPFLSSFMGQSPMSLNERREINQPTYNMYDGFGRFHSKELNRNSLKCEHSMAPTLCPVCIFKMRKHPKNKLKTDKELIKGANYKTFYQSGANSEENELLKRSDSNITVLPRNKTILSINYASNTDLEYLTTLLPITLVTDDQTSAVSSNNNINMPRIQIKNVAAKEEKKSLDFGFSNFMDNLLGGNSWKKSAPNVSEKPAEEEVVSAGSNNVTGYFLLVSGDTDNRITATPNTNRKRKYVEISNNGRDFMWGTKFKDNNKTWNNTVEEKSNTTGYFLLISGGTENRITAKHNFEKLTKNIYNRESYKANYRKQLEGFSRNNKLAVNNINSLITDVNQLIMNAVLLNNEKERHVFNKREAQEEDNKGEAEGDAKEVTKNKDDSTDISYDATTTILPTPRKEFENVPFLILMLRITLPTVGVLGGLILLSCYLFRLEGAICRLFSENVHIEEILVTPEENSEINSENNNQEGQGGDAK